jgi:hypothetical protein
MLGESAAFAQGGNNLELVRCDPGREVGVEHARRNRFKATPLNSKASAAAFSFGD